MFNKLSHQNTIDDQCNVVSYQHGRNEIIRVPVEYGKDVRRYIVRLFHFKRNLLEETKAISIPEK